MTFEQVKPDFGIQMSGLDKPGTGPFCSSLEVCAAFNLRKIALEFIQLPAHERRAGTLKGRRWAEGGDNLPLHLYKYRHLETENPDPLYYAKILQRARDFLVHGRIWVAATETLNDLHDMRFTIVQNKDRGAYHDLIRRNADFLAKLPDQERISVESRVMDGMFSPEDIQAIQANIENSMGVFCASQDPRNEPMWAHYAADHRGYCVQLNTSEDELFLLADKVLYTTEFPTVTLPRPNDSAVKHYLFKSTAWSYEREWRVVIPNNNFSIRLRPPAIASVILGAKASLFTRRAIQGFNAERVQCGMPPFQLYQATQQKSRFGMFISKVSA